jgi:hypothetical protein
MADPTSRYAAIDTATLVVLRDDGTAREIAYLRRRFIPPAGGSPLGEQTIAEGDRLDNLTARFFGDPTAFWRVCDGNTITSPDELEQVGRVVQISLPSY